MPNVVQGGRNAGKPHGRLSCRVTFKAQSLNPIECPETAFYVISFSLQYPVVSRKTIIVRSSRQAPVER